MFCAVSEASIDVMLSKLQCLQLSKGKEMVRYSSRILKQVDELESAVHMVIEIESKRALLRGLMGSFDETTEALMSGSRIYHKALSKRFGLVSSSGWAKGPQKESVPNAKTARDDELLFVRNVRVFS